GGTGGQQVGRELNPLKASIDAVRQSLDRECLSQPWHTLQQDVAIGQQSDEQTVYQVLLADHDPGNLILKRLDPRAGFLDLLRDFRSGGHEGGIRRVLPPSVQALTNS